LGDVLLGSNLLTKRHITYLNIALSAALLLLVLFFIRDIISSRGDKTEPSSSTALSTGATERRMLLEEYAPVLKNNPFGFPGGEIRPLSGSTSARAQQMNADMALIGTVVGPRQLTYAIFQDTTGMQEFFKVGEAVLGIGTLHDVKTDRVYIKNKEQTYELLLEDIAGETVSQQSRGHSRISSGFARRIGEGMYMVDQRKVQQAIENPSQMMTDARLRPNVKDGKEEGFMLSEVKPGGIYHSLGLRNGDVLLRINEYDISKPETALQAFTALRGMDRVQIDLVRAGSKMTMTYQIK
jgi:general secretion pathway protein C